MKKTFLILAAIMFFSLNVNCQWYYKKYGVKDLNQLTKEQLPEALKLSKMNTGVSTGCAAILGTPLIIIGGHIIHKAKTAKDVDTFLNGAWGIYFLSVGIVFEITGLILLPVTLKETRKIRNALRNPEIKIGLTDFPRNKVCNASNLIPTPGISVAISF